MEIKAIVSDIKRKSGVTQQPVDGIYFVACGGSWISQYPAKYLLERESKTLKVGYYTSNEFVHATPQSFTKNSIAVFCSLMGTPETEVACQLSKNVGAHTIAFCGNPEATMSKIADYVVPFKSVANDETKFMESNAAPALLMAFEILNQFEGYKYYDKALEGFAVLEDISDKIKKRIEDYAEKFANEHKDDNLIYVLAGGPASGVAYGFSICSMMEMQWINAPVINTGEFFHGPFEIVDRKLPFVLFLSDGRNRDIDLRALNFLNQYAERVTVVDARELYIDQIDDTVREYFNHFVFDVVQRRFLDNMARVRKHEKMSRRYMWKVKY
ncbi:MAG: SIS domain-containing protein [Hydrogenoanaerobacterium sp.]